MSAEHIRLRTFVLSHVPIPTAFPWNDGCVSVQCGSANGHLGGFGLYDDEFGDVADINWTMCESSAISRLAYDPHSLDGCDYASIAHYRRYVEFSEDELSEDTIICSCDGDGRTILSQYASCHPLEFLKAFVVELRKVDFSMADGICSYFNSSTMLIPTNCFAASASAMSDYFAFVRTVVPTMASVVRNGIVDHSAYSPYQKRFAGFLFERLTGFWICNYARDFGKRLVLKRRIELDVKNDVNSVR